MVFLWFSYSGPPKFRSPRVEAFDHGAMETEKDPDDRMERCFAVLPIFVAGHIYDTGMWFMVLIYIYMYMYMYIYMYMYMYMYMCIYIVIYTGGTFLQSLYILHNYMHIPG